MVNRDRNIAAWIALGVSSCLALGLIFYSNNAFYQEFLSTSTSYGTSAVPKRPANIKTRVEINFGENRIRIFEGDIVAPYMLTDILKAVAKAGNFDLVARGDKILSVAGVRGAWKIYKNGVLVEKPPSSLPVTPGDSYSLRLVER